MTTEKEIFGRILVPLDFSDANESSLVAVSRLARPGETRVALLHVIELVRNTSFEELESFYRDMEKKAQDKLSEIARRLRAKDIDVETKTIFGRRDQEILRFAGQFGADLIVLSSHRFDPETPAASWGAISHKVSLLSQCPVLLVKE